MLGSDPAAAPRRTSRIRRLVILVSLLALVAFAVYWLAPPWPYASLPVPEGSDFLLFSPDGGTLITAGGNSWGRKPGPLRVWDVREGIERFSVAADWKEIETVDFSPDSRLFAAHETDGDLRVWHTETGEEAARFKPASLAGRLGNWVNFRFSPDGQFIVFEDYSQGWPDKEFITFWNLASGEAQGTIEGRHVTLAFAPDGQLAATVTFNVQGQVKRIMLWRIDPSHPPALRQEHDISAHRFTIAPDLKTYATSMQLENGHVAIARWDMTTGAKLWSSAFNQHGDDGAVLEGLSFAAQGRILAAYGVGGPQLKRHRRRTLWDVTAAPRMIGSFAELSTISPDGQWLTMPLDAGAKLVNLSSLDEDDLTDDGDAGLDARPSCTFSPDSTIVAVSGLYTPGQEPLLSQWLPARFNPFPAEASGHCVRLWDVARAREVMTVDQCRDAHFAPDGKVLATLHNNSINLWQLPPPLPLWHKLGWLAALGLIAVVVVRRFGPARSG